VDQTGENQIVVVPGANGTLSAELVENAFSNIAEGSIILLQLEIPLASVARATPPPMKCPPNANDSTPSFEENRSHHATTQLLGHPHFPDP